MDIISIFFPLMLMVLMSVFIALITNRSPAVITATCAMVISILIWQGIIDSAFYAIVALFIAVSLWISLTNAGGSPTE
jgi:hypothetical protein